MKKIQMLAPELKTILGPQVTDYPQGFAWPYTVLVREAWVRFGKDIATEDAVQFTIPGYGVLTFRGRDYTMETTEKYRTTKGYTDTIEGTWG